MVGDGPVPQPEEISLAHCGGLFPDELFKMAETKLNFSALAYNKVLKISRTIAGLAVAEDIKAGHLSEAIQELG